MMFLWLFLYMEYSSTVIPNVAVVALGLKLITRDIWVLVGRGIMASATA